MKKNTTNKIKLVPVETEEERSKRIHAEWEAKQKERKRFELSWGETEMAFDELLQVLDRFFIESAFNFRNNLDAMSGHWSTSGYLEDLVGKLAPYARHCQNKVSNVLPGRYPDNVVGEPSSDLITAVEGAEEAGFIIGIFMGAKLAGASKDMLHDLRRYVWL